MKAVPRPEGTRPPDRANRRGLQALQWSFPGSKRREGPETGRRPGAGSHLQSSGRSRAAQLRRARRDQKLKVLLSVKLWPDTMR